MKILRKNTYEIRATLFSTGTESDDTINPDFDTMDIVDISFLDCRDMNVDEYRGDNLSGADSDSNDEDYWKNDYPDEVRSSSHVFTNSVTTKNNHEICLFYVVELFD